MTARIDDGHIAPPPAWVPRGRTDWLLLLGIIVVAFVVRALPVLRGGGLDGHLGYDDGVYFGAAVALVNGVLPYRDFLLLHPPGIALLLSPFAWIAGVTDDGTGFALARLAFMALGAVNAGLVAVLAGRYGRRAGLISGLLYAVWFAGARVELTTDLIGPQTTLTLIALLLIVSSRALTVRRAAVAGAALGAAAAIQLWAVVPLVVIVGTVVVSARAARLDPRRPAVALLGGAATAFTVICLPFLATAPAAFIRYVLIDQLDRPDIGVSLVTRLRALEGLSIGSAAAGPSPVDVVIVGAAILGAGAVVLVARRVPAARMWCVMVMVETSYLLIAPNFYSHYSAWIAPAAAIVLGTAAAIVIEVAEPHRPLGTLAQAACLGVIAALALGVPRHEGAVLQRSALETDLDGARCVSADAPDLLVITSGLRRDIEHGCPLVLDPTGVSYETDRGRLAAGSVTAARRGAAGYQIAMEEYYDDSNAAMFTQPSADGLTASTREEISDELPIVVESGTVTVMLPGPTPLP